MKHRLVTKKIIIFYFIFFLNNSLWAATFPQAGSLTFSPIADGQQAVLASADKPLVLGSLTLDRASFTELESGDNNFQGHGTFLNKEVRVGGKNFTKDASGNYTQGTLFISYVAQPELKLPELPPLRLQETKIVVQDNVEPVSTVQATFLGQAITVAVQQAQNKTRLTFAVNATTLAALLPRLQASSFAATNLSNVQIIVADAVNAPNAVNIQGEADAAPLGRKKGLVVTKNAQLEVTIDDQSMKGELALGDVRQASLGMINEGALVFRVEKGAVLQEFTGSYRLALLGAKPVIVNITSPLEQKEQTIQGTISEPLEFISSRIEGTALKPGATFNFTLEKQKLSVAGETTNFYVEGGLFKGDTTTSGFADVGPQKQKRAIEIADPMKITITQEYIKEVPGIVMVKATALKELKVSDIVFDPKLKVGLSKLEGVTLRNVTYAVNIVSGETKIEGRADITDLLKDEYDDPFDFETEQDKKDVAFNFTLKTNVFEFYLDIGKVTIPGLGALHEVKLGTELTTFATTAPPLILRGTINLPIPEIGTVPVTLTTKFLGKEAGAKTRDKEFSGVIKEVTYSNFTLKDASIAFFTKQKKFEISGQAQMYDYPVVMTLFWEKGIKLEVRAVLKDKELRPFGDVPYLSDVVFTNPAIKFAETTNRELVLSGSLRVFNEHFAATLAFITPDLAGIKRVEGPVTIPSTGGRPELIVEGKKEIKTIGKTAIVVATTEIIDPHKVAAFKDTVVEAISIEEAKIIITSRDYKRVRKPLGNIRGIVLRLSASGKALFDNRSKVTIDPQTTAIPELDALNELYNGSLDEVQGDLLYISFDPKIGEEQKEGYIKKLRTDKGYIVAAEIDDAAAVPEEVAATAQDEATKQEVARAKRKRQKLTKDYLYRRGVSLEGKVVLTGFLSPIAAATKKVEATKISGLISLTLPKILDSTLVLKMPTPVRIVEKLSLKDFEFAVRGFKPPKISLTARATFNPTPGKAIIFALKGGFSVGTVTMLELSGSAQGSWEQVFGYPITLTDMGLGIGILIPPVPAKFALTGKLETPKKTIGVTASADLNLTELALIGETNSLTLMELIGIGFLPAAAIPISKEVPNFELTDVKIYFAPKSFSIGDLTFTEGIGGAGKMRLFGHHSQMSFKKSSQGYQGSGSMGPFDIGAVQVSGKTAEKGPEVKFEISQFRKNFIIAGDISIGKFIKKHGEIVMTDELISFSLADQLTINDQIKFGYTTYAYVPRKLVESIYRATKPEAGAQPTPKKALVKKAVGATPWAAKEILDIDVKVKVTFDNTLGDYLIDAIATRLKTLQNAVNTKLGKAQESLEAKKDTSKFPRLTKASREVLLSLQKFLNNILGVGAKAETRNIRFVRASFEGSAHELLEGTIPHLEIVLKVGDKEHTYTLRNLRKPQEALDKVPEMVQADVEKDMGLSLLGRDTNSAVKPEPSQQ